jgi:uncharacterized protein (DUF697 family)
LPKVELAKAFWKTIKSVSVKEIAREAERPFAVAVVGSPAKRQELYDVLFPKASLDDILPERSLVRAFDSTSSDAGFPTESGAFDLIIDAGGGRDEAPEGLKLFSLDEIGSWDLLAERLIEERPDLALSMARRFPGLRPLVSQRIIKETAIANAEFAMLSALPGIIPIIGALLPPGAIADILILTKNQGMMLFRLAAIHELPLDASSRSRDLAPLLANAFGWRAIARELVGGVPGGIGMVARGSIAYAGTVALGKGILKLYETGNQPTRAQINQFYREALDSAKGTILGISRRIRPHRKKAIAK